MKQLAKRVQLLLKSYQPLNYIYLSSLVVIIILFALPLIWQPKTFARWISPDHTEVIQQPSKKEIAEKEAEKQAALKQKKKEREQQEKDKEAEEKNKIKEVASDDPNVIKAYEGTFKLFPTNQKGEHRLTFEDGSIDRMEIHNAASHVLNMNPEDLLDYWVNTAPGEDHLYIVLTDTGYTQFYRVYMHFIEGKGWQVTRYEQLHELTGEG
ncbi:DUF1510 family protein [Atopobacter phocae]|uniref:DUF1510 family protein n=1 Tax=Atopobacter phocae TaxID=136492 RepID=UPI00046FFFF0|nr:DUF1510 family protein [Atopobacter phocae]